MPRQIIDTESSRPAYHRRLVVRWLIVVLVLLVAALIGLRLWQAHSPRIVTGAVHFQEKGPGRSNLGPVPHYRRKYAA
jgi:hypothetical protein